MDIISGFKSELFRPLVTLVIPGAVATAPHIIVVGHYFPQVPDFWDKHPSAFVAILVVAVIATGLVLEDIGGVVESAWDKYLDKGASGHYARWKEYLKLRVESEFIGQRYLRTVLVRMKFELAMLPALVSLTGGLIWLQELDAFWSPNRFKILILAVLALFAYLICETYRSAKTLGESRNAVLEGAKEDHERKKGIGTWEPVSVAPKLNGEGTQSAVTNR